MGAACHVIYCAHNELSETGDDTKGYLMRAVSPVRFSNMKAKWPFVNVSVLHIVEHEYSALQ